MHQILSAKDLDRLPRATRPRLRLLCPSERKLQCQCDLRSKRMQKHNDERLTDDDVDEPVSVLELELEVVDVVEVVVCSNILSVQGSAQRKNISVTPR